jgi:tRNA threonylcarbamoyl adenosine modification protein (Sua5/YciO/YrdC/YwlC family)
MVILPIDERALDEATQALAEGNLIAVPTDTVYGLAVDTFQPSATARLFAAKQRPHDIDLPVLIGEPDDVHRLVSEVPPAAAALIERWWPGPLTVVLRRRPGLDIDLGDRTETVGVRCPAADAMRELARRIGPLATTSANLHGQSTPATALEIATLFRGSVAIVLDGGPCTGAPSTVVDLTGDQARVLREGAIPVDELRQAVPLTT